MKDVVSIFILTPIKQEITWEDNIKMILLDKL
jgi:hypothetical protein